MIKIEIIGMCDLLAFVAIIRNENLDIEKLKQFTKELNDSSAKLEEAENQQKGV